MTDENQNPPLLSRRDALKIIGAAGAGAVVGSAANQIKPWIETPPVEAANNEVPPPTMIDGYETYGSVDTPLTVDQIESLFKSWSEPMEADTIYSRKVVPKSDAQWIEQNTPYSTFQQFQAQHDRIMTDLLATIGIKFEPRCLIISTDEAAVNGTLPYITDAFTLRDTDGVLHAGLFDFPYKPTLTDKQGYLDVDPTYPHEATHQEARCPDEYSMDMAANFLSLNSNLSFQAIQFMQREIPFLVSQKIASTTEIQTAGMESTREKNTIMSSVFENVPSEWRQYVISERSTNDPRSRGIMTSNHDYYISSYQEWLLKRRISRGFMHDKRHTIPEHVWDFPHEVPTSILNFGNDWIGPDTSVEIFRSRSADGGRLSKEMIEEPIATSKLDADGEIVVGDLWSDAAKIEYPEISKTMIPNTDTLVFIKLTKRDSNGEVTKVGYRWLDIGDFSIGTGTDSSPNVLVRMTLNVGTDTLMPSDIDTEIKYEDLTSHIYLPTIQSKLQNHGIQMESVV